MRCTSFLLVCCLVLAYLYGAAAAVSSYSAPNKLDQTGQLYQIAVWSFVLLAGIGIAGFYFLGAIDYTKDTLFYVDIEQHHE